MSATDSISRKRRREQSLVAEMIALYCHHRHKCCTRLCNECAQLAAYAAARSEHCPFMAEKTFCSVCTVHCYSPEMREKIRAVMRYAGPRMIFYHPVAALRHLIETRRQLKNLS